MAVNVYKRYPWVDQPKAVMAAPDFIYNSHWSIKPDGTILIPPTTDWMCGDLCQRAWSIVKGLTAYYQYSGDPVAFIYIPLVVDYILDYGLTDAKSDWPLFPISTPTRGKAYGKCDPGGRNQLDLCAITGTEVLRAYKLTGNKRYSTWQGIGAMSSRRNASSVTGPLALEPLRGLVRGRLVRCADWHYIHHS